MNISVRHPSDRPNFCIVYLPGISIAFSYETPIAYSSLHGRGWVVRENEWGPTTGKHLNEIEEDKSLRIPGDQFERQLMELIARKLPTGQYA